MKIAVAGTGYVGLVTGTCLAETGHDVVCVDIDEAKIKVMESGVSPIYEEGLEELMQKNYAAGRIRYTTDYATAYRESDVIFIGVGTPERPDGSCYTISDDRWILEFYWERKDLSAKELVHDVLSNENLWDQDLTQIPGLEDAVAADLEMIREKGAEEAFASCL